MEVEASKDKDKGKGVKPLLEAKGPEVILEPKDAAPKAKDAALKAKEADPKSKEADPKATDSLPSKPGSKDVPSPPKA